MTVVATKHLTKTQARQLTDEVKADAAALWAKLLKLYEGEAHKALGYSSWGTYYEAEFGQSGMQGYRLLDAARVAEVLPNNQLVTESTARELVPVLEVDGAQAVNDTYSQAQAEHGPKPTAKQVKETVEARDEVKQTIIARAGRGDAQKDIARDVDLPITEVAKIVDAERKATKPKRTRTAAPMPPPTLDELAELAKELLDAAKATNTAHAKFKKSSDLEDGKAAGFAAAAASTAAAAYNKALIKHLDHMEPTT